MLEVINPLTTVTPQQSPLFLFHTPELIALVGLLHEQAIALDDVNIPILTSSPEFPYQVEGKYPDITFL